MRTLVLAAALVQAVLGGGSQFAVRLPFLNPAGVTYVNGPAPAGLAAGPAFGYAASAPAAFGYAASAPAAFGYAASAHAPLGYAAAPAHLGYAAAPAAVGYAAVPTVHHVPGVADVPVTRVEAQPGVIQKLVDVAKPGVQTRRFEVRRPAIQKQFYDVEERVVVRPAGSALVELEQPLSKVQRGPAVISPAFAAAPVAPAAPVFVSTTPAPAFDYPAATPSPSGPPAFDDQGADDSVVIDSEFAARSRAEAQSQNDAQARFQPSPAPRIQPSPPPSYAPGLQLRSGAASYDGLIPEARAAPAEAVIPSQRDHIPPEISQANQQRLIQLLTARGGVAEVGFGRAGPAGSPVGDAGITRARVLSATPAPDGAAPAGERVQTRRVVVSRPIETVQEFDVVEPVTKLERVAVHHPTLFKTLRQDVARVPTSVPVFGKALAPAIGYYH